MNKTILLIDIDSRIVNLALKKIEKYHLSQNDKVLWNFPLMKNDVDKIYVSCIFTKNRHLCEKWEGIAEIGGTGYDIKKKLPKKIDKIKVRINYGFTTRGCIRKCKFCFVPEKEGGIHVVDDLYDIWDGHSKEVIFLDNNALAAPDHFKLVCSQVRKENLKVDYNQGLDVRLLTDDLANEIKKTRFMDVRFAFDHPSVKKRIEKKMPILHKYNIQAMWYILVGFNSNFDEEKSRVDYLISHKQRTFIMRHENCYKDKRYSALGVWCNAPGLGKATIPFDIFLNNHGNNFKKYFKGTKHYTKSDSKNIKSGRTLF